MRRGGAEPANAEDCFGLGMIYSSGAGVAVDLVQAHKWFNIAAMRGHKDAAQLRREIAEQMSDAEIGCAQRAARDWLKVHPQAPAPIAGHPRRGLIAQHHCAVLMRNSASRTAATTLGQSPSAADATAAPADTRGCAPR